MLVTYDKLFKTYLGRLANGKGHKKSYYIYKGCRYIQEC